ncbi:hypothetical protein [Streptomyces tritici]|uniref:hypothetical protein n=1 Tax=Streptomyces tritici TaxID=2054410 RepID=UPI003AF00FAF
MTARPCSRAARSRPAAGPWRVLGTVVLLLGVLLGHVLHGAGDTGSGTPAPVVVAQAGEAAAEHAPAHPGHECSPLPAQGASAPSVPCPAQHSGVACRADACAGAAAEPPARTVPSASGSRTSPVLRV